MTKYTYTVNGRSEVGALSWNANSTLKTLGITDPFNAGNAQNCTYIHDDLTRLQNVACGSVWAQSFNYDAFGNTTKSGSSSWMPLYNSKNQYSSIPGFSNPGPTYDANCDLLTDSFHTYTWDADGHVTGIDSIGLTYDALGRQVEQNQSGTYFQIVYSPMGSKLAVMKGQTIQQAFVPLPGGTTAEYLSWGLSHYRHPDWLGNERLESSYNTTTHQILQDTAYAPFGEPYAELSGGNEEISFTGQNKDTDWLNYDFIYREYDPRQSRWLSPDPAGADATDPTDPQSWNRYAYVENNPLSLTDPLGLDPPIQPVAPPVDQTANPCGDTATCVDVGPNDPSDPSGEGDEGQVANLFGDSFRFFVNVRARLRAPNNGRNCSAGPARAGQYVAATAEVATLTSQYASGLGPGNRTFGPGTATSTVMGQSAGVQDVLNNYYMTGQTSGLYTFGAAGAVSAGGNPVAQFVGSFRWSMSGGVLSLTNTTSFRSLTYDAGPQWQRSSFGPGGNTHQTYQIGVVCH